jgi:hypothetical protein
VIDYFRTAFEGLVDWTTARDLPKALLLISIKGAFKPDFPREPIFGARPIVKYAHVNALKRPAFLICVQL